VRQIEMHTVERANPGPCINRMLYRKVVVVRTVNCRPHDERLGVASRLPLGKPRSRVEKAEIHGFSDRSTTKRNTVLGAHCKDILAVSVLWANSQFVCSVCERSLQVRLGKLLTGNQSDRSFNRRVKDNSH
jgi:hypothetical protein